MTWLSYGDLQFDTDYVFALSGNGEKIKFSKLERALLVCFTSQVGKLLTRERLLDSIEGVGSDSIDRNVDYLISRLRRKLGDSSRAPRFIATQYGEGYIWIASPQQAAPSGSSTAIFLSVGPIYGLAKAAQANPYAATFTNNLAASLREALSSQGAVELFPDDEIRQQLHLKASFALELSFITTGSSVSCNLVVVNRKTGQVFSTHHVAMPLPEEAFSSAPPSRLANAIKDSICHAQIFRAGEKSSLNSDPLSVGLYKAAQLFEHGRGNNVKVEQQLRQRLNEFPDDHHCAILLANNLSSQIFAGNFVDMEAKHQEIENLIFDHLPALQDDALYLSSIAERLLGLGHVELSETLAERALELGPAYAACYMVVGRIHVYRGDIEEGLSYYQHCLEMSERGSPFYRLVQTLRVVAYLALDDQDNVNQVGADILEHEVNILHKPVMHAMMLARDTKDLPLHVRTALRLLPINTASNFLRILHYIASNNCSHEHHRANVLRGFVTIMLSLHGEQVIPDWIKQEVPSLFEQPPSQLKCQPNT